MAKKRSPAHPAYGLEDSIKWAKTLFEREGEHYIPMDAVALVWNASAGASSFQQRLSSLKQYGLLEEKGAKDDREFKLTELALDIFLHQPEEQQRKIAISTALLKPPIHQELIEKYDGELPPQDASVRSYLLRGRDGATFNVKQVDGFIERFRSSIEFSSTNGAPKKTAESSGDTSNNGNDGPDDSGNSEIKVGSVVQWTSNGVMQFRTPLPISSIEIAENGEKFAYFEAVKGFAPMSELSVAEVGFVKSITPMVARENTGSEPPSPGQVREETYLDEGVVKLVWPENLSSESVADFEYWVNGLIRKAKRRAGMSSNKVKSGREFDVND